MCYSDFLLAEKQIERFGPNSFSHFLLAEKQIERFGPNPFSHFLLAEKQIEPFGEIVYPVPFTRHKNGRFRPTWPLFDPGHYWQCLKCRCWWLDQVFMACMLFITHLGYITCLKLSDQIIRCSTHVRSRPLHLESWCGGGLGGRKIIMQTMLMQYNPFKLFNNQYYHY